jgi:hypothetical protein
LVLLMLAGHRVYCVAALQNATVMAQHIGLEKTEGPEAGTGWEDAVIDYVAKKAYEHRISFSGASRQKLRAFLLSRIEVIIISDPEGFSPEIGTALARFSHLRVFGFYNLRGYVPEKNLAMLFTQLRQTTRLEALELSGITNDSFAILAGHPNIRRVRLVLLTITPEITATLKTFPNLKEVSIMMLTKAAPGAQREFQESLPGVKVQFE